MKKAVLILILSSTLTTGISAQIITFSNLLDCAKCENVFCLIPETGFYPDTTLTEESLLCSTYHLTTKNPDPNNLVDVNNNWISYSVFFNSGASITFGTYVKSDYDDLLKQIYASGFQDSPVDFLGHEPISTASHKEKYFSSTQYPDFYLSASTDKQFDKNGKGVTQYSITLSYNPNH